RGSIGSATLTVTASVTNPGVVSDLTAAQATDSSVTLSFTEVSDGTGQPASYEMRRAAGAMSWDSAGRITEGTCKVPMSGSTIGATRTCTVLGLSPATAYAFQLRAYRGTLDSSSVVYGDESN